jgi:hypothetical protein
MGHWMLTGQPAPSAESPSASPVIVNLTIHNGPADGAPQAHAAPTPTRAAAPPPRDEATLADDALYAQLFGQETTHG